MSKPAYEPPTQSVFGQVVDAFLVLALVLLTLYLPLLLGLAGGGVSVKTFDAPTWEALGQNAAMAEQWTKLGFDTAKSAEIIGKRFDYEFSWAALGVTVVVIVGYFAFMLKWSDKEYRDVIAERFADGDHPVETARDHRAPLV